MDFNLITLVILAVVFVAGAFLGVLLGRRSKTTNAYVDSILKEKDRAVEKARELEARYRDKL